MHLALFELSSRARIKVYPRWFFSDFILFLSVLLVIFGLEKSVVLTWTWVSWILKKIKSSCLRFEDQYCYQSKVADTKWNLRICIINGLTTFWKNAKCLNHFFWTFIWHTTRIYLLVNHIFLWKCIVRPSPKNFHFWRVATVSL